MSEQVLPDFFLGSSEHRGEWAKPRACWLRAHLRMQNGRDAVLVEIDPPVIGQPFGLGEKDIANLILVAKWKGKPIPDRVVDWVPVLVFRMLVPVDLARGTVHESAVILQAWGEIYPSMQAA